MSNPAYSYTRTVNTFKKILEEALMEESTFPGLATPNLTADELEATVSLLLENLSLPIIEKLPTDIVRAIIVANRQGHCPTNTLSHLMCAPVMFESFQFVAKIFNTEPRQLH